MLPAKPSAASTEPPPAASATVAALDSLAPIVLDGPYEGLDGLCGKGCVGGRALPTIRAIDQVTIAVGRDPRNTQPDGVKTTFLAMRVGAAWYGTALFREGDGVEHLEVFNPPDVNEGAPVRVDRPVRFDGSVVSTDVLASADSSSRLIAITTKRSQGESTNVLVLCGARLDDGPRCVELETWSELVVVKTALEGDVVRVTFGDGVTIAYTVFGD